MDILDNIEIGEDAAGLLMKASLGVMLWNRRNSQVVLFLDIDTYINNNGVFGDKITGNLSLDKKGKYDTYEMQMIASNDILIDIATGAPPTQSTTNTMGEYDFLNAYFNNATLIKQVIKGKIQSAASRGQLK